MKLHTQTVAPELWAHLLALMQCEVFDPFRLVGGTSLSLQLGHRVSADIDLFTDDEYGTMDFMVFDHQLENMFNYVDCSYEGGASVGKSYFVGDNSSNAVKLDIFYTDSFAFPLLTNDHQLRMAPIEEISAMKLEVISSGGRKKDFWDLHEILEHFSLNQVLEFYRVRYPYGTSSAILLEKMVEFDGADSDFDPICLRGKYWELIKLDLEKYVETFRIE